MAIIIIVTSSVNSDLILHHALNYIIIGVFGTLDDEESPVYGTESANELLVLGSTMNHSEFFLC